VLFVLFLLNGKYKLPSGPGLGIDLDYNKLSKYEI